MIETSVTKSKQADELVAKAAKIDDKAFITLGVLAYGALMMMLFTSVMALVVVSANESTFTQVVAIVLAVLAVMVFGISERAIAALVRALKMRKEAGKLREEARALEESETRHAEQREREKQQLAAAAASDARAAQARAAEAERVAKAVQDTQGQRSDKNAQAVQNPGYRESEGRNKPGGSPGKEVGR